MYQMYQICVYLYNYTHGLNVYVCCNSMEFYIYLALRRKHLNGAIYAMVVESHTTLAIHFILVWPTQFDPALRTLCVCVFVYACACACACACARARVCARVCACARVRVRACARVRVCVCVCLCVCVFPSAGMIPLFGVTSSNVKLRNYAI